jgi:hypothetical protein
MRLAFFTRSFAGAKHYRALVPEPSQHLQGLLRPSVNRQLFHTV